MKASLDRFLQTSWEWKVSTKRANIYSKCKSKRKIKKTQNLNIALLQTKLFKNNKPHDCIAKIMGRKTLSSQADLTHQLLLNNESRHVLKIKTTNIIHININNLNINSKYQAKPIPPYKNLIKQSPLLITDVR